MKRLLAVVPIAAFALMFSASSAHAQVPPSNNDPSVLGQIRDLRLEARSYSSDNNRIRRELNRCQMPDADYVVALQAAGNDLSRRLGAMATQLPGRQHAQMIAMQESVELDYWLLSMLSLPDHCYVPA